MGEGTRKIIVPAPGLNRIGDSAPRKVSKDSAPVVTYGIFSLSRSPLTTTTSVGSEVWKTGSTSVKWVCSRGAGSSGGRVATRYSPQVGQVVMPATNSP